MQKCLIVLISLTLSLAVASASCKSDEVSETEQNEFYQQVSGELDALDENIARLEQQAEQLEGQNQAEARLILGELRQQQEAVRERIGRVRAATGAHWDEVKAEVTEAVSQLQASYDQAAERLQ